MKKRKEIHETKVSAGTYMIDFDKSPLKGSTHSERLKFAVNSFLKETGVHDPKTPRVLALKHA